MTRPFIDRLTGIESCVQTLEGLHWLIRQRDEYKGPLGHWFIFGTWWLNEGYCKYSCAISELLEPLLPDVISLDDAKPIIASLEIPKEDTYQRSMYRELQRMLEPPIGLGYSNLQPVPASARCAGCGGTWLPKQAASYVHRDRSSNFQWEKRDDTFWHRRCNLLDLAPDIEPWYREFLVNAGFTIHSYSVEPNGHAGWSHMAPWCSYRTDVGVIRIGLLSRCVQIDHRKTNYLEDLLPEEPTRTKGPGIIEVSQSEIPICLTRLRAKLTAA